MVMHVKVRTSVLIEKEILKKAQELGLNVSQCLENALRLYINAIETANQKITSNPTALTKREVSEPQGSDRVAGPPGFEPGISGLEGRRAFWISLVQAAPRTLR